MEAQGAEGEGEIVKDIREPKKRMQTKRIIKNKRGYSGEEGKCVAGSSDTRRD